MKHDIILQDTIGSQSVMHRVLPDSQMGHQASPCSMPCAPPGRRRRPIPANGPLPPHRFEVGNLAFLQMPLQPLPPVFLEREIENYDTFKSFAKFHGRKIVTVSISASALSPSPGFAMPAGERRRLPLSGNFHARRYERLTTDFPPAACSLIISS